MPDVTPNSQASSEAANPVDMISALLDAEKVTSEPKQEAKVEAVEVAQPETESHEPSQNAQVEGEDAQAESEKQPMAEIPLEQLEAVQLEVTYKGEDGKDVVEKQSVKELREGYMRTKDYHRKTKELSRKLAEADSQTTQSIQSERTSYQETLKQLQALVVESVAPELKTADWNALATNDPFEYVRLRNRAEQIQQVLAQIKSKETEVTTKQKAEQSQSLKKKAQETWQKLEADIPGFNNELYQSLLKTGVEIGIEPEKVSNWIDAGEIKLLHKAYLYDQLKAGKPAAEKKVVVAQTAIKPGAANVVPAKVQRQGRALEQLKKTGSINDLANFLSS